MLSVIGFLVGTYILARALSFALREGDKAEPRIARYSWIVTGIVASGCLLYFIKGNGT